MSILKSRHLGRFRVPIEFLNELPEANKVVTAQLTAVVRTTLRIEMSDIEYVAICDAFPEVPEGNAVPLFTADLHKRDDGQYEFVCWRGWDGRPIEK